MATSLCSVLLSALLVQTADADSTRAAQWARVAADSTDATAWLELGRTYVRLLDAYHTHAGSAVGDTAWARGALDTADQAFARAARWGAGTRAEDSAEVFRVFVWGEKAYLAWEAAGAEAAEAVWTALPETMRLPPVLEELGENLLRACPQSGLLLTAGEADTHAAWSLRFGRRLRPDLLIVPLARWRSDTVFRGRVVRDGKLRASSLRTLAQRRALCASMAFERAPDVAGLRWHSRPLVWVTGAERKADRVPPQDFVFAALRLAVDERSTWGPPAIAVYRRAAEATSALCRPLETFGLKAEVGCR